MSTEPRALRLPVQLKIANSCFVFLWLLVAAFPLFWILTISFKLPIDAFSSNPLQVVFGYHTLSERGGVSLLNVFLWLGSIYGAYKLHQKLHRQVQIIAWFSQQMSHVFAWMVYITLGLLCAALYFGLILPLLDSGVHSLLQHIPLLNLLSEPFMGLTLEHYQSVWIDKSFYKNFYNSMLVTAGVVCISLSVATLAGYGLARSGSKLAFWLLILALIFRALPHSVLVTGYLPVFINSAEFLQPLWTSPLTSWFVSLFADEAPTLYGQRLPVIIVLVAINQPFTIWMLRSFFMNIPSELDEAARVDGCSQLQAFRLVIMPVMWPGVITAGLFSFLLAYNDYLVTSLLLDYQAQTMVPAISQYFNRETTTTDEVEAVAAAVSIVIPLFFLVMAFQRQIVSGLTQGAVKG